VINDDQDTGNNDDDSIIPNLCIKTNNRSYYLPRVLTKQFQTQVPPFSYIASGYRKKQGE